MKKITIILVICLGILSIYSHAQNATIIYSTASNLCNITLNPSCCNVFNMSGSNTAVGGYQHWPLAGGATYDGTYIIMSTRYDISTYNNGTGYAIQYPFKVGYTYNIAITASYKPMNWAPTMTVGSWGTLPNPSQTNPTACGAVGFPSYYNAYGNVRQQFLMGSPGLTTYPVTPFSPAFAQSFLSIVVDHGSTAGSNVYISKVTITETSNISFTIDNSVTKTCGTALSKLFTITNTYNTPGVTSYNWNLGSTPNGWYYQGNPAPATISTATNTITLTANACDLPPQNITATAYIGPTGYNTTNTCVVNSVIPSLSISGNNAICSGSQTYSVSMPCSGTVSWSVMPAGIVSLIPSGNQVSLTYITNGNIVLTASVSMSCTSNPITLNKEIPIGIPVGWNFPIFGPPTLCINQNTSYSTMFYGGVTYNWSTPGFATGGGAGPVIGATAPPFSGGGQVILNVSNACGNIASPPMMFVNFMNCFNSYAVTPNPAKGTVRISIKQNNEKGVIRLNKSKIGKKELIYAIKIIDKTGIIKRTAEYRSGVSEIILPLDGILSGTYTLTIFNGTKWESQPLVVQ